MVKKMMVVIALAGCGAGATRIPANLYKERSERGMRMKIPDGWLFQFRDHEVHVQPKDSKTMKIIVKVVKEPQLPPDEAGLETFVEKQLTNVLTGPEFAAKVDSVRKEPIPGGKIVCVIAKKKEDDRIYNNSCIRLDAEVRQKNELHVIIQVAGFGDFDTSGQHFLAVDLLKDAHL